MSLRWLVYRSGTQGRPCPISAWGFSGGGSTHRVYAISRMLSGYLFTLFTAATRSQSQGPGQSPCSRTHSGNLPARSKTLCCGLSVRVVKRSLELLSEDVVKSQPRRTGAALAKPEPSFILKLKRKQSLRPDPSVFKRYEGACARTFHCNSR